MASDEHVGQSLLRKLGLQLPEWCLLRHAVRWVTDDLEPISVEDYQHQSERLSVADARFDDTKNALLIALRNGALESNGILQIYSKAHPSYDANGEALALGNRCREAWKKTFEDRKAAFGNTEFSELLFYERSARIDPLLWDHRLYDWDADFLRSPTWAEIQGSFMSVCVRTEHLAAVFNSGSRTPVLSSDQNPPQVGLSKPRNRSGRKPEYDWEGFYVEIAVIADLDGLPDTQAHLTDRMRHWCSEEWDKVPSESRLKEKISRIYNHKRKSDA
jgi:hypothetical protein